MILGTAAVIGAVTVIVITACFRATGISIRANKIDVKNSYKKPKKGH